MAILITIAILFMLLSLCILVMPLKLFFRGAGGTNGDLQGEGEFHFLNGAAGLGYSYRENIHLASLYFLGKRLFRLDVTRFAGTKKAKKKKEKKSASVESAEPEVKEQRGAKLKKILQNSREYLAWAKQSIDVIREIIRFDLVIVHLTLGLGNPALTGLVTGFIYAFNELIPPRFVITPSFDFTREIVRGDCKVRVKISLWAFWKNLFVYGPIIFKEYRKRKSVHHEALTQEA